MSTVTFAVWKIDPSVIRVKSIRINVCIFAGNANLSLLHNPDLYSM